MKHSDLDTEAEHAALQAAIKDAFYFAVGSRLGQRRKDRYGQEFVRRINCWAFPDQRPGGNASSLIIASYCGDCAAELPVKTNFTEYGDYPGDKTCPECRATWVMV